MSRLFAVLTVVVLLSGCESLMPVTGEEAKGFYRPDLQRTDIGGYYQYDDGRRQAIPPWHRF